MCGTPSAEKQILPTLTGRHTTARQPDPASRHKWWPTQGRTDGALPKRRSEGLVGKAADSASRREEEYPCAEFGWFSGLFTGFVDQPTLYTNTTLDGCALSVCLGGNSNRDGHRTLIQPLSLPAGLVSLPLFAISLQSTRCPYSASVSGPRQVCSWQGCLMPKPVFETSS